MSAEYTITTKQRPHDATVEVRVEVEGRTYDVTVFPPDLAYGCSRPARVNWSALGSVPVRVAEAYAEALSRAVEVAAAMNEGTWEGRHPRA